VAIFSIDARFVAWPRRHESCSSDATMQTHGGSRVADVRWWATAVALAVGLRSGPARAQTSISAPSIALDRFSPGEAGSSWFSLDATDIQVGPTDTLHLAGEAGCDVGGRAPSGGSAVLFLLALPC
jgi:hypothetical protein